MATYGHLVCKGFQSIHRTALLAEVLYLSLTFNLSRISQPVRPAQRSAVSMAFLASTTFSFLVLTLFSFAPREVVPLNYASIASDDGGFKLRWAYNNNTLMFNLTCKTTGWCAVGFTTTADGKRMVNYDIALGGVASNSGYLDVSQLLQSFKSFALGSRTECQFKRWKVISNRFKLSPQPFHPGPRKIVSKGSKNSASTE